jgi:hypothetical protein
MLPTRESAYLTALAIHGAGVQNPLFIRPDADYPEPAQNWPGIPQAVYPSQSYWSPSFAPSAYPVSTWRWSRSGFGSLRGVLTADSAYAAADKLTELQERLANLNPQASQTDIYTSLPSQGLHDPAIRLSANGLLYALDPASLAQYQAAWAQLVTFVDAHPVGDGSTLPGSFPPDVYDAGHAVTALRQAIAVGRAVADANQAGAPAPANIPAAIKAGTRSSIPTWAWGAGAVLAALLLAR